VKLTKKNDSQPEIASHDLNEAVSKKQEKSGSPVVGSFAVGAIVGLALALIICFFLYQNQVTAEKNKQLRNITQQKASLMANSVARHLKSEVEKVEFFAVQTTTRNALGDDETALNDVKRLVQKQVQDSIAISVFEREEAALNSETFPPIRFSELALIREAESGGEPAPEVVNIDNRWYMHFIRAIKAPNSEDVLGVLWVVTGTEELKRILVTDMEGLGKVSLYQNFGVNNRPLMLSAGAANTDLSTTAAIANTNWELEFVAGEHMNNLTNINVGFVYMLMFGVCAGCVAVFGLAGYFVGIKRADAQERKRIEKTMSASAQKVSASDSLGGSAGLHINKSPKNLPSSWAGRLAANCLTLEKTPLP